MKKILCRILIILSILMLCGCTPLPDNSTAGFPGNESASPAVITSQQNEFQPSVTGTADEATASEYESNEEDENITNEESASVYTSEPETAEIETAETTLPVQPEKPFCTVVIKCTTVLDNFDALKNEKKGFIPSSGVILSSGKVYFSEGDSAFDVLQRACSENTCDMDCVFCQDRGIQLEYNYTPAFSNYYIEGIHQLYEKDCGSLSGWMYSVNGSFPTVGISQFTVSDGDIIVLEYTCDMGEDIGNTY